VRLLLIVLTAVEALLAVSLLFYRATRRTYRGFDRWTLAEGLQAGGYLLLALRGFIPDPLSILGGNVVFPLAAVVRLEGVRRFTARGPMSRGWWASPVGALALLAWFTLAADSAGLRTAVTAVFTGVPVFWTAALIFRSLTAERPLFSRTIAATFTVLALLLLGRAVGALLDPRYSLLRETPLQVGIFLTILLAHIASVAAFMMLNAERVEHELSAAESSLTRTVAELQKALAEVKTLSGLLPICASCKRIRDEHDHWTRVEEYVRDRTHAEFSHGICPECAARLYPDLVD